MREKKETPSICMNGDGKNITEQKEVGNHNKTESRNDLVKQGFFFFFFKSGVVSVGEVSVSDDGRGEGVRDQDCTFPELPSVCVGEWSWVLMAHAGSQTEMPQGLDHLGGFLQAWLLLRVKIEISSTSPRTSALPQGWGRCWKH